MSKLEAKIEVQNIEKVETLINLLDKYQDDLPKELVDSLRDLSDCEACEISYDNIKSMLISDEVWLYADGENIERVSSFNMILKRVICLSHEKDGESDCLIEKHLFPKTMECFTANKTPLYSWGV